MYLFQMCPQRVFWVQFALKTAGFCLFVCFFNQRRCPYFTGCPYFARLLAIHRFHCMLHNMKIIKPVLRCTKREGHDGGVVFGLANFTNKNFAL
jgi:hypothetical protein